MSEPKVCQTEDCERDALKRGMCQKCYSAWYYATRETRRKGEYRALHKTKVVPRRYV